MKLKTLAFLILIINVPNYIKSQEQIITFQELLDTKVDENIYEFGWFATAYKKIPCYRDYRKNSVKMTMKNPRNGQEIDFPEAEEKGALKISPYKIKINKEKKRFSISGEINGAWKHVTSSEFEIYIGYKKDTISNITLSPNLHGDIYFNGKKVDSTIIINTVPAFYLKDFKKYGAILNNEEDKEGNRKITFEINSEFDDKSYLVFGISSLYSEIFHIGKLLE
ncbi:hypothetical protein AB4Y90_04805 [Chryseobacterium sp. 2TAF14]|uniref:hypothetical protein n=1 Tax=Chryseobacterium sp. 2TAF14 TaxID=3233007 RepID=UPI003F90D3BC